MSSKRRLIYYEERRSSRENDSLSVAYGAVRLGSRGNRDDRRMFPSLRKSMLFNERKTSQLGLSEKMV